MNWCCQNRLDRIHHYLLLCLLLALFHNTIIAAEESKDRSGVSELSVKNQLAKQDGEFLDLFVNFKKNPRFRDYSREHRLDDPAVWSSLRRRFVLNIADLRGDLSTAEAMAATKDSRSSFTNQVVSSERTRAKGRLLKDKVSKEINNLRQMLRLIDEFEAAFEKAASEQALTSEISIENEEGQSFPGQVLFLDGNDLIVRRAQVGYFRILAKLLSGSTKQEVMDQDLADWEALPEMNQDPGVKDKNAGELIAYSDTHLYIEDRFEGLVSQLRSESDFIFTPYKELIKEAEEADIERRSDREELLKRLQEGSSLNQSRVETIKLYESRLSLQIPESERKEAKAYREEKYPEAEATPEDGATEEEAGSEVDTAAPEEGSAGADEEPAETEE